jgi:putative effector of murein hydrolase LrgA (UPF0299 family)
MQSSIEQEYDAEESAGRRTQDSGGRLAGVKRRAGGVFSPKAFLVSLVAALLGMFVLGGAVAVIPIPYLPSIAGLVGLFLAAFALGAARSRRQYVEMTLAGALTTAGVFTFNTLTNFFLPIGVDVLQEWGFAIATAGAILGGVTALAGHYFGRDLRNGLTQEL